MRVAVGGQEKGMLDGGKHEQESSRKWPQGQKEKMGTEPWAMAPKRKSTDPSQVEQSRGLHMPVCLSEYSGSPLAPQHIYPNQPCPTSVIPVAECP